jgi:hypothetical protein
MLPKEIIIIDDGSEQLTLDLLKTITHPILKIVYQENMGVCHARNRGIELAETEFILTLDADDYFEPTFIEKAVKVLASNDHVAMVCCYYRKFYEDIQSDEVIKPKGGGLNSFLVSNNGIASGLFKKESWESVNGYDNDFKEGYEDWDFNISILVDHKKMYIIEEVLYHYRIKSNSRDKRAFENYDLQLRTKLLEKHKELYRKNSINIIKHFMYTNSMLRMDVVKSKKSIEYRLGAYLLMPFRLIRKHIFR